jgi:hypothetical protein
MSAGVTRSELWFRGSVFGIFSGVIAITSAAIPFFYGFLHKNRPPTLEQKITVLTGSLNNAARAISDIEQEIQSRQQFADKLRADAEEAKKIATLNKEQVDAVAQTLRGQLQEQERASYWPHLLANLFFAALGVALTELYRWVVRRLCRCLRAAHHAAWRGDVSSSAWRHRNKQPCTAAGALS